MFRTLRAALGSGAAMVLVLGIGGCVGSVGSPDSKAEPGGAGAQAPGQGGSGQGSTGQGGGGQDPSTGPGTSMPEHVPLRRLTRTQYNNTIRDLLGIEGDHAAVFGLDEREGGFDANSKAPVKELVLEKYREVAKDLASKAVATLDRIAPCASPASADAGCVDAFLATLGRRAYRRPLTSEESDRYKQLYQLAKDSGADYAGGIELLLSTMLQSPHFLYRPELGDESRAGAEGVPLTAYETASRLSYLFLNSMPDEVLFTAADGNELGSVAEIAAQAERLLAKPQARETIVSFHAQWLHVDELLTVEKNADIYPDFNDELRAAMKAEVDEFVDQVARQGDGKLETLLAADFSYVPEALYDLYGLDGNGNMGRVDLPSGQRAGLFTLPAVMTRHSHADQTSLVGRGALVSDRLLCIEPPSPPDDVDAVIPKPDPNIPTRKRFEEHRADPQCAACHQLMDPLGIPFEIYDGIGKYRTIDGGEAVDATSALAGTDNDGPVKDATELMKRLSQTSEVRRCMTQQWFRYVFGRMDTAGDGPAIDAALQAFGSSGHQIPDLLVALSTTNAFRFRRPVDQP